jgi:hypothetical protein
MIDPGAAQALIKQLNRWYRKRAKPRGIVDHFHRGTRMSYTTTFRAVNSCIAGLLLAFAAALYFVPGILEQQSTLMILLLKLGWGGIVALALGILIQTFGEYAVVTDDGIIKFGFFGRETRMDWKDIRQFHIKPDSNDVIFRDYAKRKLKLSLSYDGWRDFIETAARRLEPALYHLFYYAFVDIDAKKPVALSALQSRWARWFSQPIRFGRTKSETTTSRDLKRAE